MLELPELLKPDEVAGLFRVDRKTVYRWGDIGVLPYIKTPGGQRRHSRAVVLPLLQRVFGTRRQYPGEG